MDDFSKVTLNNYGWEMATANEYGKKKLQKEEKKRLRKLSRTRLKRDIKYEE